MILKMVSKPSTIFWLFVVIVLEGYVVLSSELLAIRQSIPYSGSGTETVSVIIAAVLMPLAFGYYAAGRFKPRPGSSVRKKLIINLFVSMLILLPGLSYIILGEMYQGLLDLGIRHRLIHVSLYSLIFIVTPVFLLGQTIPLISNYFGKEKLAQVTGRILFFSTLGSFMGAVVSTLVLMAFIGVNNTVALNFVILAGLIILLSKRKFSLFPLFASVLAICAMVINSNSMEFKHGNIIEHNKYNSIAVFERGAGSHLYLNNSPSSKYEGGRKYFYVEFAERVALDPIFNDEDKRDILVVGAGAFTFGYEDVYHNYDFVDIDANLKRVAEEHILPEPLTENKVFHPMPARAFLSQTDKKYDVVFLDTYFGRLTVPEHLLTVEFFEQVKAHIKDGGVLVTNFATSPNFVDRFSRNLDNTMRYVFPYVSRHVVRQRYLPWNKNKQLVANIAYVYTHHEDYGAPSIYTDNKNQVFLDKP